MSNPEVGKYWLCLNCNEIISSQYKRACNNCFSGKPPGIQLLSFKEAEELRNQKGIGDSDIQQSNVHPQFPDLRTSTSPITQAPPDGAQTDTSPSPETNGDQKKDSLYQLQLVAALDAHLGRVFKLKEGENVLGRSLAPKARTGFHFIDLEDYDLATLISQKHLLLIVQNHQLEVMDEGSKNGTWIDHNHLTPQQRYPLQPESKIRIGALVFKVISSRG